MRWDMDAVSPRASELLAHAGDALARFAGACASSVSARDKAAVVSFLLEGAHAHDLATLLDLEGIAVRSGHHCAHPLMQFSACRPPAAPRWRSTTRTTKSTLRRRAASRCAALLG
jgi:selenocysteine lyase/cysteine desulfurase